MRNLIVTTALAAALAGPAFAQTADMTGLIKADDITDGPVYSIAAQYDEAAWADRADRAYYGYQNYAYGTDYEQIGEIEDIVLDESGQMVGIVADVGGFLGIGDKHVLVMLDDVRLVPVSDADYSYITRLTEEQLEALPSVDEGWFD